MCKTKECGHCGEFYTGRQKTSLYCSRRCYANAAKKRSASVKIKRKKAAKYGQDWESKINKGIGQFCKVCVSFKDYDHFNARTKSGISTCFGCSSLSPESIAARKLKANEGKRCKLGWVTCVDCGKFDTFNPKEKRGWFSHCGSCSKAKGDLVKKLRKGRYADCLSCGEKFRATAGKKAYCSKRCYGIGQRSIDYDKGVKTCTSCLKGKDIKEFHKCGTYRDGSINYESRCKRCEAHRTYNKYNDPGLPLPTPTLPFDYDYRHKRIQVIKKRFKVVKYRHDNIGEVCCLECSAMFRSNLESHKVKSYCTKCSYKAKANDLRHSEYESTPDCIHCNKPYYRDYGSMTTRCKPCTISANRASRAAAKARRRTAMLAGRYMAVDPIKVFKRDKWRCKMCNVKTHKRDIYADDAAELDHVVPLSKGGNHIPSNLQCLCRRCNAIKSDRLMGQASLFSVPLSG